MRLGRTLGVVFLAFGLALAWLPAQSGWAQEQFFTQSGGRGLQNAKTNARLSKAEGDIGDLQTEMAKVQPFAKTPMNSCSGTGDKLRWSGTAWTCDSETDPTVQGWAKEALPTCSGASILGVSAGHFSCVNSNFVTNETDPTVQAFAKAALPACGTGQVLTVVNGVLGCVADERGLTREVDPMVHDFARTDKGPVPQCNADMVLTMENGLLKCKVDQGIKAEVDPFVQSFARSDIPNYTLAACGNGELLHSKTDSATGKVLLECISGAAALAETLALNDLSDVTVATPVSSDILIYNGTEWVNGHETDPSVKRWAKVPVNGNDNACPAGQVVSYDGTQLTCVNDAGGALSPLALSGLSDVNVSGTTNGNLLQYKTASGKWEPAQISTCATGYTLTSTDGVNFSCTQDAGGSANPLSLNDLSDVTISSLQDGSILHYVNSSTGWVNSPDRLDGTLTDTNWCRYNNTTGNVECDLAPPSSCSAGQISVFTSGAWTCTDAITALGLGTMALQNADSVSVTGGVMDGVVIGSHNAAAATFTNLNANYVTAPEMLATSATFGVGRITTLLVQDGTVLGNLNVQGNLNVSGSQTIGGVTFAQGGMNAGGDVNISGTTRVQDLEVLGNQSIAGVLFANGGIQMSGDVIANRVSATYVSASVADITNLNSAAATISALSAGALGVTNVSATGNVTVGGDTALTGGLLVNGTTAVQDLFVRGSLYVSGSQSIDGVVFANGGLAATGTVSATGFSGDGSGLYNIPASAVGYADRIVSGTSVVHVAENGAVSVTVGGSNVASFGAGGLGVTALTTGGAVTAASISTTGVITMHNTGAEACTLGQRSMRIDPASGKLQICRD